MFDTIEDRVRLLKKGFTGKEIEKAYLTANGIKLVNNNILFVPKQ